VNVGVGEDVAVAVAVAVAVTVGVTVKVGVWVAGRLGVTVGTACGFAWQADKNQTAKSIADRPRINDSEKFIKQRYSDIIPDNAGNQ
jgi:hypothetical protein